MIHPLNVAWLLADLKFDQTCVAVGLLHDVLEDTLTTREVLEKEFGAEIAELVDGVTKIGRHEYVRRDEAQAETFRKMILASAKDIRVIVVKLADRLHNMQTLEHLAPEARRRISRETLEIYSPIAHRLGMATRQGRPRGPGLLPPLPPPVRRAAPEDRREDEGRRRRRPSASASGSPRAWKQAGIDAEISFRVKRYYSIYEKLRRQGIDISQLYDYLAFRIVTGSLKDTYAALGVVHQNWRPIPGRFKDYIAMPKPNLYQSLHTTVVGDQGQPFEVQIRTREMDLVAEEGIAAHWRYKEGKVEAAGERPEHPLAAPAPGVAEGGAGPAHLPHHAQGRPLSGRGLRLHAQGGRLLLPARGDAARLRLPGAHRPRPPLRRRAGQRQAGAAAHAAPERRHGGDPDQPDAQPEPRLAEPGRHLARQEQDPAVAQHAAEAARHGDRPPAVREGDPQVRPVAARRSRRRPELADLLQDEGLSKLDDLYSRIGFGKTEPQARAGAGAWGRRSWRSPRRRSRAASRRGGQQDPAVRRRRRGPIDGQGARRPAGLPRQVLQPAAGRGHRRLRHARARRLGALGGLPQRAEPALQPGARDRGRVGAGRRTRSTRSRC